MDIYLVNSGPRRFLHARRRRCKNALYKNNRDGTFTDVTEKAGVAGGKHSAWASPSATTTTTATPTSSSPPTASCTLYHNNGNGTFTDITDEGGARARRTGRPAPSGSTTTTTASSICSSAASSSSRSTTNVFCGDNKLGTRYYCIPRVFKPTPSLLFHNNGDGTFTEVSRGTDIQRALGKALGVVATDINNDGLMDLFVANDTVQNFLFANRGKGKWEEIGLAAEVAFSANGTPRSGMGVDAADFDRTAGRICSSPTSTRRCSRSTRTTATRPSRTSPHANGVAQATRLLSGWGLKFFDYDNDGHVDLFLANGHPDDMIEQVLDSR